MDERALRVGDRPGKTGLLRHFAEEALAAGGDGDVRSEAPSVKAVRYAANRGVMRRAAVAAGDDKRARAQAAQPLHGGGEPPVEDDGVTAGTLEFPEVEVRRYLKVVETHG